MLVGYHVTDLQFQKSYPPAVNAGFGSSSSQWPLMAHSASVYASQQSTTARSSLIKTNFIENPKQVNFPAVELQRLIFPPAAQAALEKTFASSRVLAARPPKQHPRHKQQQKMLIGDTERKWPDLTCSNPLRRELLLLPEVASSRGRARLGQAPAGCQQRWARELYSSSPRVMVPQPMAACRRLWCCKICQCREGHGRRLSDPHLFHLRVGIYSL